MKRILFKDLNERERRTVVTVLMALAVPLALITLIPAVGGIIAVNRLSKDRADEAVRISEEVNKSRAEITYSTCLDQNDRNAASVKVLDDRIARRRTQLREAIQNSDSPAEQASLRAQIDALEDGRSFSVDLINAVLPVQNCRQITIDRFGYVPVLTRDGEPEE